jgi:hypothetical protein
MTPTMPKLQSMRRQDGGMPRSLPGDEGERDDSGAGDVAELEYPPVADGVDEGTDEGNGDRSQEWRAGSPVGGGAGAISMIRFRAAVSDSASVRSEGEGRDAA